MLSSDHKKVLGLDIGANSIGFALLKLDEQKDETLFEELTSNSIVFSNPDKAKKLSIFGLKPPMLMRLNRLIFTKTQGLKIVSSNRIKKSF